MIPHLSSEEVSEYILGYPRPAVARHLQDCPDCRAELAQFRETLGDFRDSVRGWSEQQAETVAAAPASLGPVQTPRWGHVTRQLAWAVAIAILCVVASFVLPRHTVDTADVNDAVLLNRVDAQVSSSVPGPMEPLTKLVVQAQ